MKLQQLMTRVLTAAAGLLLLSIATAGKPDKPGSGGGGGTTAPYTLVDLQGLPGGPGGGFQSDAVALSEPDAGGGLLAAGNSHSNGMPRPAGWVVKGDGSFTISDLGLPPGATEAGASGVNDLGIVTVNTWQTQPDENGNLAWPAWVLVPGRTIQQLPMAGSTADANAINNLGEIAGSSLWRLDADGTPGNPLSLGDFYANDINDLGVMAGHHNGRAAIAWFDADDQLQVLVLDTTSNTLYSEATSISADGTRAAGVVTNWDRTREAFLWTAENGMSALGRFGGVASVALGVNNAGQVVGWSDTGGGKLSQTAVLWQNGEMIDLNDLVDTGGKIQLLFAKAVNEAGYIAGSMRITRPTSEQHGFLLKPNLP